MLALHRHLTSQASGAPKSPSEGPPPGSDVDAWKRSEVFRVG